MTDTNPQAAFWNSDAGHAWVDNQAMLDHMFQPFEALLADAVRRGEHVLDVGCGTGATTLAAARRAGAASHATGIDISAPMIATARIRAAQAGLAASFVCADAQHYPFEAAGFDAIVSRFGVMFFADPVAAFANLRRATRAAGRLHLYAWRGADENPFMTAAERAAAPLVTLPPRLPGQPGQFAFADAAFVRATLQAAGWHDIGIDAVDVPCAFPAAGLDAYVGRMGPLGRVLPTLDAARRQAVLAGVRRAFDPFVQGETVRYTAACWRITARAHVIRG
ncbi:class I SAM-dependent methyltransferase [[Empedobacter] haloabium]|uniref:Class I SAM-dependent methyltransferase n=1 Tax=[Empedobacter] haloabium TaxID=592317 RepID=A0ABZ1UK66_9BURK